MENNLERLLSEAGIRIWDTETKQSLYMMTILFQLYIATGNDELKKEIERYFLKIIKGM